MLSFPLVRRSLSGVIFLVLILSFLSGNTHASPESYWRFAEKQCHGNLALMLKEVERSPGIPYFRTNRSARELFETLKQAGRFFELGLSEGEGEVLVKAVYERLKVNAQLEVRSAGEESTKTLQGGGIFPYRAGTEFEKLDGVLMRWPFDWTSQAGKLGGDGGWPVRCRCDRQHVGEQPP